MRRKQQTEEVIITGFVRATDWDWQDDVSGISIETHDDEEYVIDPNELEESLFLEVDREVELTGTIEEDDDGTKHIIVTSYRPFIDDDLQEEEDYEVDQDYEFGEDYDYDEDYDCEEENDFETNGDSEFEQEALMISMTDRWGDEE
jgi:hypothetical protein